MFDTSEPNASPARRPATARRPFARSTRGRTISEDDPLGRDGGADDGADDGADGGADDGATGIDPTTEGDEDPRFA